MNNVRHLRSVTDITPPAPLTDAEMRFDQVIEVLRTSHENTRRVLAWAEEIQRQRLTG